MKKGPWLFRLKGSYTTPSYIRIVIVGLFDVIFHC